MQELGFEMTFNTHQVRVIKCTTGIRCWKQDLFHVDFAIFDDEDTALDYIVTPFPSIHWHIEMPAD